MQIPNYFSKRDYLFSFYGQPWNLRVDWNRKLSFKWDDSVDPMLPAFSGFLRRR